MRITDVKLYITEGEPAHWQVRSRGGIEPVPPGLSGLMTHTHGFRTDQFVSGKSQVFGVAIRALAEHPSCSAHIRKKADSRLRHSHAGSFRSDNDVGCDRQT